MPTCPSCGCVFDDHKPTKTGYAAEFAVLRALYPKREGAQVWPQAEQRYTAHRRAGVAFQDVLDGVRAYAALCNANGNTGTSYVCQAVTFFGPQRRWEEEYAPAPEPIDAAMESLLAEARNPMGRA